MRLFVIPISTRRALIYSRTLGSEVSKERSVFDRVTDKAAATWAKWEGAGKGWQKHIVSWGNRVQQRIPYEEWGLKSIPSLSTLKRHDETHGTKKIEVLFPGNAIKKEKLHSVLHKIATERQDLHRQRMWWSFIATPFTAPIALIPIIPNIPFFYLVYRGWSHWRALSGSKHLEYLVKQDLLHPISHPGLEELYAKRIAGIRVDFQAGTSASKITEDVERSNEKILLHMDDAKKLASILEAPGLALEAERALYQVEEQLKLANAPAQKNSGAMNSEKKHG